jgi:hypothetical protein
LEGRKEGNSEDREGNRRVWWCGVSCINKHSSIRELGMSLEFNCKSRHGWFHISPFSMLCLFLVYKE